MYINIYIYILSIYIYIYSLVEVYIYIYTLVEPYVLLRLGATYPNLRSAEPSAARAQGVPRPKGQSPRVLGKGLAQGPKAWSRGPPMSESALQKLMIVTTVWLGKWDRPAGCSPLGELAGCAGSRARSSIEGTGIGRGGTVIPRGAGGLQGKPSEKSRTPARAVRPRPPILLSPSSAQSPALKPLVEL